MISFKKECTTLEPSERLNQLDVPVVALTGGIATGKSSVSKLLSQWGFPVIDADKNVKAIYASKEGFKFVSDNFSQCIVNNEIDFKLLRKEVFNIPKNKEMVEAFIYSRLPNEFIASYERLGRPSFVIYDVPLLFEKSLDKLVDTIITVYCPVELQLQRLMKRDNIEEALAKQIISSQDDIEIKKKESHLVIENSGSLKDLEKNSKETLALAFESLPF